jgi:hypothetical protein
MADIRHVADFDEQVAGDFALHTQIVLVRQGSHLFGVEERNRGSGPLTEWNRAKRRCQRLRKNAGKPSRKRNTLWNSAWATT